MTFTELLKLADRAGLTSVVDVFGKELIQFAALIEQAERDQCAKICEAKSESWWTLWKTRADPHDQGRSDGADECGRAIRLRKSE